MDKILLDISYIISILIEIGLPLLIAIFMWKKYKVSWSIFFLGMAFFIVSLIRIPLNNLFASFITVNFIGDLAIIITGLFASITAGLFEEGVRALAFGTIIKKRDYETGIMYGIGHGGGGESMIFVGISVLFSFLAYRFFPDILPGMITAQLENISWYMPLVGAMERIFAISIQISLSLLVINAFIKRKYYFILLAVVYHVIIDFVSVYINYKYGLLLTEILVFVFAVISLFIIYILKPGKKIKGKN